MFLKLIISMSFHYANEWGKKNTLLNKTLYFLNLASALSDEILLFFPFVSIYILAFSN